LAHLIFAGFVGFSILRIIFKKQNEDDDFLKLGYLLGYAFLFFANLTAFNFVLTQLYSFLLPTLYVIATWKYKVVEPRVPRILNILNVCLFTAMFLLSGNEIFQYWNADRYFSLSRRSLEADKNMTKAIDNINMAVAIKDNDCRFYLRKSSLIRTNKIATLDKGLAKGLLGKLSTLELEELNGKLKELLQLP